MDDTALPRALLTQALDWFDPRTRAKGADYVERGRVEDVQVEELGEAWVLMAAVQGAAKRPYETVLHLGRHRSSLDVQTQCSCPVGVDCKHAAAVVLWLLQTLPTHEDIGDAVPAHTQLGPWSRWLEMLAAQSADGATASTTEGSAVAGIALRVMSDAVPSLMAQPVWLKPNRRGVPTFPKALRGGQGDPWAGMSEAQLQCLGLLRLRSQGWVDAIDLGDVHDADLIGAMLELFHCYLDKPGSGRLQRGPLRKLDWQWLPREDGDRVLTPRIDGAPAALLLRMGGLWYLDQTSHELGPVEGDLHIAQAARRAPSLSPEQTPLLAARWASTPSLAALPPPPPPPPLETLRTSPTPLITLRGVPLRDGSGFVAGVARLAFDYDGLQIASEGPPRERRRRGERVLEIVRDRTAEIGAMERLEELGLTSVDLLPPLRGAPPEALGEGDYVLPRQRAMVAPAEQLFALAPRLRDAGFRLESAEGFPFELLDEPDAWYSEIEEGANAWFDLRLGIDIGGERVDLLPILRRLLADPAFPLSPRRGEPDDATWLVPLDDRRRIPLSLKKLRELIAPLLEWLGDAPQRGDDGKLRLRRGQLGALEGSGVVWRGAERVRAMLRQLNEPRDPADEPAGFGATLRPYQRDGVAWLRALADGGLGGVLADDMGLGKTVQVLAHLLDEKQRGNLDAPALIVAPTSLVTNWRDEAARFAPALSVLVLHGPARAGLHEAIPRHDVVITTYPLLLRDRDALIAHDYALLVLDEAQAVKNARSQAAKVVRELPARRRLAMTGTPLENHLGELWAQFDAVEPGLIGNEKHFVRYFRTPIEKLGDAQRRERLKRRIAPLLLRRRKEDVLADLPAKTEILRRVELEGEQRALYETLRLAQHERVLSELQKRGLAQSGIVVLDALLKLRQACCDPRLVKLDAARDVHESAKLDLLLELLESLIAEGRRVLLFSQFTEMLELIANALDYRHIEYLTLTGQTPGGQRAALVRRFQAGQVPLFLISLKAGGVGLNLTAADTVIHYDPWWNPAVEDQASDRAHRIGQDKPVFVYKLICADTVEEKIQALQQRKAELAAALLDGGDTDALRFDEEDVAELFGAA